MSLQFTFFYGAEAEQYSFYRIPKTLFSDKRFKAVSMEAKVLYGLMLDRMSLSIRNGWLDDDGRVYIYFTLEDAVSLLGCGKDKALNGEDIAVVAQQLHLGLLRCLFCFNKAAQPVGDVVGQPRLAELVMGLEPPHGQPAHVQFHPLKGEQRDRQAVRLETLNSSIGT